MLWHRAFRLSLRRIARMAKYRSKKLVKEQTNSSMGFIVYPLLIIAGFIPLVMRYVEFNSNTSQFAWDTLSDLKSDTSTYVKSILFLITCIIILLILAFSLWNNKWKDRVNRLNNKLLVPLGIYALLAIISTIFSKYQYFGIHGMMYHFESIFVLLGYCLIVFYSYVFIKTELQIKTFVSGISKFVAIMGIIGLSQFFNHDFWTSNFGMQLMLPSKYLQDGGEITKTMPDLKVNLSLFNPNYVGLYVGIMIPFFCVLLLLRCNKIIRDSMNYQVDNPIDKKFNKIKLNNLLQGDILEILLFIFILFSMVLSLIGSKSANGYIAISVSAALGIFIALLRTYKKNRKIVLGAVIIIVCIFGLSYNTIREKVIEQMSIYNKPISIEEIETKEDHIAINYKGNKIRVSFDYNKENGNFNIHFLDNNNNVLDSLYDQSTQVLNDSRFNELKFIPTLYNNEIVSIGVMIDGTQWNFTNQIEDGSYYFFNMIGRPDKIITPESALFNGLETFGNGRGYIWSRTIPLLKDNLIIGSGPDTYIIQFPQNDYVGLYNYASNQLIDKPHNMYLQIAVQTGVLSLLALIVFWVSYIIWSIKLYIKADFLDYKVQVGFGSLLAVIGFLVSALMNDSTITVSPVFWVMIGLGIAINYQLVREQQN